MKKRRNWLKVVQIRQICMLMIIKMCNNNYFFSKAITAVWGKAVNPLYMGGDKNGINSISFPLISTVIFDDKTEVLYDRVPVSKVEPMNENQYYVRGCNALLDALGRAIHHIGNVHKYVREEDRPEKTLFILTTDGMENSRHEYSYDKVKKMVEKQKKKYG